MSEAALLSFYPGPSQLRPSVARHIADACASGILSRNHRSPEFVAMYARMTEVLRDRLDIPADYHILTASSATECWEILAQSFGALNTLHIANGAFGQKWADWRKAIAPNTWIHRFGPEQSLSLNDLKIYRDSELICLVQTETSNATQVKSGTLRDIRRHFPQALVAVDATSSMAGIALPWLAADLWFASVQKCFGLPAGLAVLVCSPRAAEVARRLGERRHYNSLIHLLDMSARHQTTHTPNVLGIFLLEKVMAEAESIHQVSHRLKDRCQQLIGQLERRGHQPLIANRHVRADTVLALRTTPEQLQQLKSTCAQHHILLGNGYGPWKDNTFRIANFPALSTADFERLYAVI